MVWEMEEASLGGSCLPCIRISGVGDRGKRGGYRGGQGKLLSSGCSLTAHALS